MSDSDTSSGDTSSGDDVYSDGEWDETDGETESMEDIGIETAIAHARHVSLLSQRKNEFDDLCVEMRMYIDNGDKESLMECIHELSLAIFASDIFKQVWEKALDMGDFTPLEREKLNTILSEFNDSIQRQENDAIWKEVILNEEKKSPNKASFRVWVHDAPILTR
tara:strand:- start:881 stop:1375 length:495 start_codon:yes stop_codon:yes gene_type:complete